MIALVNLAWREGGFLMFKTRTGPALGGTAALVLAAVLLGTAGVAAALWDRVQITAPLTITLLRIGFAIPLLFLLGGRDQHRPNAAPARPWRLIGALGAAFAGS